MTNSTEHDLLNLSTVKQLKEVFQDNFDALVKTYLDDYQVKANEMKSLVDEKKIVEIARLAHNLKGSSLNMGSVKVASYCNNIEVKAKSGDFTGIESESQALSNHYPLVQKAFAEVLGWHAN